MGLKRIAAIVTEYRYNSHAEVILGRLLGDFSYQPRIEVASIYTDQVPAGDMSHEIAKRLAIPIYPTIRKAIRNEGGVAPIDGVVIIGEHGNYPVNEKGQTMYPRRRMLEETLAALAELDLNVPIFSDKHLAYNYEDALWMYKELKKRNIPFMGGSSIPHTDPIPAFDRTKLRSVNEIVVVSPPLLEGYGIHALEVLQSLAERRLGGETGVGSVRAFQGGEVWTAMDRQEWPEELLLEAMKVYPGLVPIHPRDLDPNPLLIMIEYTDGTKGFVVQLHNVIEQWGFAFRNKQGETAAALCNSHLERPFNHFERFAEMIESFMITRQPPFPMERTLLTTGMICYAVDAFHFGRTIDTPELEIAYQNNLCI